MPPCKLLIKAEVGYKITQLLVCNCKALKKDLDSHQDLIKKSCILINGILVNRYQNYSKIIIEMIS